MYDSLRKPKITVQEKECTSCKKTLPATDFPKSTRNSFGLASHCKECRKSRYPHDSVAKQIIHVRNRYGLEVEELADMYDKQQGLCAICSVVLTKDKTITSAHIDHNHETGTVRGILCAGCNTGLGMFKENPEALIKAIEYLEIHTETSREFPAIYLRWDDAEVSNEWENIPSDEELEESSVETLGFLVKETPKYYWIASTLSPPHTNARTKVPKSMVKEIRTVRIGSIKK